MFKNQLKLFFQLITILILSNCKNEKNIRIPLHGDNLANLSGDQQKSLDSLLSTIHIYNPKTLDIDCYSVSFGPNQNESQYKTEYAPWDFSNIYLLTELDSLIIRNATNLKLTPKESSNLKFLEIINFSIYDTIYRFEFNPVFFNKIESISIDGSEIPIETIENFYNLPSLRTLNFKHSKVDLKYFIPMKEKLETIHISKSNIKNIDLKSQFHNLQIID